MSAAVALPCAEHPRASVLIAAFGSERFEHCLRSLADALGGEPAVEVIAVLNGAGPELRRVAGAAAGLRVIDPPVNLGFPAACNLARALARGHYLVVVQDDGRLMPGWLESLVRVADAHPEAGLVGSVTLWPDGERIMQAGQVLFTDGSLIEVAAGRPPSELDGREPFAVDTLSSHGLLVRADTWDAVGGLDEDYFPLYMVDLTLSSGVWARGEAVLCAPNARAEHTRTASTRPRFREFLFRRHYAMWRERWATQIAEREPRGESDAEATERALARAESRWRRAHPGPEATVAPTPAYDPNGDEEARLAAGIRFAKLALQAREEFADSLEERLDQLERHVVDLEAENARASAHIDHVEAELAASHAAERATPPGGGRSTRVPRWLRRPRG